MKLKTKLIMILLAGSLFSFLLGGSLFVWRMQEFYVKTAAENYEKQMDSMEYVFTESMADKDLEQMGELAREAYLNYQFRRCFGEGYALLKQDEAAANMTGFEILDASLLKQGYVLQHLGMQTILLLKREISEFPGYGVLCAQDISAYYEETRHQLKEFCKIFTMVLAVTCLTVYLILGRVLRPLKNLTETAARLGNGDLSARADISRKDETGELAAAFNTMAARVEEQVDDLRLLLGALTHEIKTPMTSIIGYSDTLLRVNLPEERWQKALKNINHAGKRLERLSAKMLALLGSYGTEEISLEPCMVEPIIREVEMELEPFLTERQITVETEYAPDFTVMADQELLTSLLGNLVNNAIKASAPGSRIWIYCDREKLMVMDEGCGIPADALAHERPIFHGG